MLPEQLLEFFNTRFQTEYRSVYRPFNLDNGQVSGSFGTIKINSRFHPIRQAQNTSHIIGHSAHIEVSNYGIQPIYESEIERLLVASGLETITNLDRLSRTVHLLNFLKYSPGKNILFLEINPLHILGVKQDHGVYFDEFLKKCGVSPSNVVIVLRLFRQYSSIYPLFVEGLINYRRQGYKIALKLDRLGSDDSIIEMITKLRPNFVTISAMNFGYENASTLTHRLIALNREITSNNGLSILEQIDNKETDSLAYAAHFDLVEGSYYRSYAESGKPEDEVLCVLG